MSSGRDPVQRTVYVSPALSTAPAAGALMSKGVSWAAHTVVHQLCGEHAPVLNGPPTLPGRHALVSEHQPQLRDASIIRQSVQVVAVSQSGSVGGGGSVMQRPSS